MYTLCFLLHLVPWDLGPSRQNFFVASVLSVHSLIIALQNWTLVSCCKSVNSEHYRIPDYRQQKISAKSCITQQYLYYNSFYVKGKGCMSRRRMYSLFRCLKNAVSFWCFALWHLRCMRNQYLLLTDNPVLIGAGDSDHWTNSSPPSQPGHCQRQQFQKTV